MQTLNLTREDYEKILMVKAVLEKKYYARFTHQELSQMAGTNERKLRYGFKQIVKKTIYEFQTEVRIEKVKDFLENSELSLKMISVKVGLDHSNVVKTFKKHTGYTPKEWRRMHRKNDFKYWDDN